MKVGTASKITIGAAALIALIFIGYICVHYLSRHFTTGPPSSEIVLVFSLEHMKTIAHDGFSRSDIQAHIHQQTRRLPENVIIVVAGGSAGQWMVAMVWSDTFGDKAY